MKIKKSDLTSVSDIIFNYMISLTECMDHDDFAKEEHKRVEKLYKKINKILENN